MTQHEMILQLQRNKEYEARKRIEDWFNSHPNKKRCEAFYRLAGGHFINGIEKNEYGIYLMRTDTGGLAGLMDFGADVLSGVVSIMEQ